MINIAVVFVAIGGLYNACMIAWLQVRVRNLEAKQSLPD